MFPISRIFFYFFVLRVLFSKFRSAESTSFAINMSIMEHNVGYVCASLLPDIFGGLPEDASECII